VTTLIEYARSLVAPAGKTLRAGEVFAKVLTANDDSGRHGVLIPADAYAFFPDFEILEVAQNATITFGAYDSVAKQKVTLAYKYYQRYPERRITRLQGLLNDRIAEPRLIVVLKAEHIDGSMGYYVDCANSAAGGRFADLFRLVFGTQLAQEPGRFVVRPVDSDEFSLDKDLSELVDMFDGVRSRGWLDSMRAGDTGIGYTFETLLGIKENNDSKADFKGIEIKCKGVKEGTAFASGKINLFQHGPVWYGSQTAKDRIRILGRRGANGLYACHSQITTLPNNRGVQLVILDPLGKIDLRKSADEIGYWAFRSLEERLKEKHARAVFVKARSRSRGSGTQFSYEELVYCERPSIDRFVTLVRNRSIVFEFLMNERPNGTIRNHGYPWRLIREEFLDQLYSYQVRLR
jgi:hypothetical protein